MRDYTISMQQGKNLVKHFLGLKPSFGEAEEDYWHLHLEQKFGPLALSRQSSSIIYFKCGEAISTVEALFWAGMVESARQLINLFKEFLQDSFYCQNTAINMLLKII